MQREQTGTEHINGIEVRHYDDGSLEAQYQGKTSSCAGGFVHCAVGRVLYWNETGRTMDTDRCLHEIREGDENE